MKTEVIKRMTTTEKTLNAMELGYLLLRLRQTREVGYHVSRCWREFSPEDLEYLTNLSNNILDKFEVLLENIEEEWVVLNICCQLTGVYEVDKKLAIHRAIKYLAPQVCAPS